MIKLTLAEAFDVSRALAALPRINAKTAYDLARIRDKLKAALRPVEEQRIEIVKANGGEVLADGVIRWKPLPPEPAAEDGKQAPLRTGQAAADAEYADYLTKEIEIDREPVKLAALLGPDPAKYPEIAPEILSILEKIIVE